MTSSIRLRVGPVSTSRAREWIASQQRLILDAREGRAHNLEALDLLDLMLELWSVEADRHETFDWTYSFNPDVLLLLAACWLDLRDDARHACAPHAADLSATDEFDCTLVLGLRDALATLGPVAEALISRISAERRS